MAEPSGSYPHWHLGSPGNMETQVQNEPSMSYSHMSLDRRDSNLDNSVSTPFQPHQSISQALGSHLSPVNSRPYQDAYRIPSPSTTPIHNGGPSQSHSVPSNAHPPLNFAVQQQPGVPPLNMKRKPMDGAMTGHLLKRRRDEEGDSFDSDGGAQGAKHWTDEEKTKLFTWLMGPSQDDHWNALRATKNSCLRECAVDVFGSKKTYQALKGCYERNFNLFKQIYAFEAFHARSGPVNTQIEAERLREYERRLQTARKGGCDAGNISARVIDHWHRAGWYDLFYARWNGDPATTRPASARHSGVGTSTTNAGEDQDVDEDIGIEYAEPPSNSFSNGMGVTMNHSINGLGGMSPNNVNVNGNVGHLPEPTQANPFLSPNHNHRDGVQSYPNSPTVAASASTSTINANPVSLTQHTLPEPAVINFSLAQNMMSTYMQHIHTQTQTSKLKLELLRKREDREAAESIQRNEIELLRAERERAKWEHEKKSVAVKQKADRAVELLSNPSIDNSTKLAASDYLKRMFATD